MCLSGGVSVVEDSRREFWYRGLGGRTRSRATTFSAG